MVLLPVDRDQRSDAAGLAVRLVPEAWRGRRRQYTGVVVLTEEGRRLASQREDLIAQGVDPALLVIPLAPVTEDR